MITVSSSLRRTIDSISKNDDTVLFSFMRNILSGDYNTNLFVNPNIDYITMRGDKTISFLPDGKEHIVNEDGTWSRKNRVETTVGRFTRKLIDIEHYNKHAKVFGTPVINDKMIEDFVIKLGAKNMAMENFKPEDCISIVKGVEIAHWYLEDCYAEGGGSLNNSCMRYENCQEYFGIYTDNPKQVSMLIFVQDDLLHGRCILWHKDGKTYFDRIYYTHEYIEAIIKEYCLEQGWQHASHMGSITLDKNDFRYYPYLDTMFYYSDGKLYSDASGIYAERIYRETGGGFETGEGDDSYVWSDYEDRDILSDDAVWCNPIDSYVHINNATRVIVDSRGNEEYYPDDHEDIVMIGYKCYHRNLVVEDIDGDYILLEDATELSEEFYEYPAWTAETTIETEDGHTILESDAVELDTDFYPSGGVYHEDSDQIIETTNGGFILKTDSIEIDGEIYHKDDETVHNTEDQ